MSWEDRDYYRVRPQTRGLGGILWTLFMSSVPLGTWFGIRVRVHATLVWFIVTSILFNSWAEGTGPVAALRLSAEAMGILFAIILLHEFGHCFAARFVGGEADDILMWPLGGLAYARPPHRPLPQFLTVAGGPAVNVLICLVSAIALLAFSGARSLSLNPMRIPIAHDWTGYYLSLVFYTSYLLLLFNLIPMYPLDGGQMLQSILWHRFGYFRSMHVATTVGMVGAVVLAAFGLKSSEWMLIMIAIWGFMTCYQQRAALREASLGGVEFMSLQSDAAIAHHHHKHLSRRMMRQARKRAAAEQAEQARIDAILDKVSAHGMHSLNWFERRALRKATERQRDRDVEAERELKSRW